MAPVQASILNCFGDMVGLNLFGAGEVSDGTPDFLEQRTRKYLQGRREIKGFEYYRWSTARSTKSSGSFPYRCVIP